MTAPYQAMACADGHFVMGANNQKLWLRLCEVIGRRDLLADERFSTIALRLKHRAELQEALEQTFRQRRKGGWVSSLLEAGIPAGPILSYPEAFGSEHARVRGMRMEIEHPVEGRVPNIGFTVQKAAVDKGIAKQFPLILSSGRLVEYEGGGEETRSNKWLAELQQDMFIEINPADAAERGIKDGGWVLVSGAEMPNGSVCRMKALVTERVGKGVTWSPFHFAGWFMNVDQRSKYPKGTDPIVLGESVNALTTYGYDPVTGMQEPKATLCQIRAA